MAIQFVAEVAAKAAEVVLEATEKVAEKAAESIAELGSHLADAVSEIPTDGIDIGELDEPVSGYDIESFSESGANIDDLDEPISQWMTDSELSGDSLKYGDMDIPTSESLENSDVRNCPRENGTWTGERGNSKWIPDEDVVFTRSNPDGLPAKEIFDQYGIDGIDFEDGEPDFSPISKGEVQIDEFSGNRPDNFDQADIKLAEQKGCTPEEVEKWRKENKYTWHECKDMWTMQKVPSIIHINVPHRGGVSEYKNGG